MWTVSNCFQFFIYTIWNMLMCILCYCCRSNNISEHCKMSVGCVTFSRSLRLSAKKVAFAKLRAIIGSVEQKRFSSSCLTSGRFGLFVTVDANTFAQPMSFSPSYLLTLRWILFISPKIMRWFVKITRRWANHNKV